MNYTKPKAAGPALPNCPVCGKTTYSHGGIHPQCAAERADRVARETRKAALEAVPTAEPRQLWTKVCPGCQRRVPARRGVCDCGFTFVKRKS